MGHVWEEWKLLGDLPVMWLWQAACCEFRCLCSQHLAHTEHVFSSIWKTEIISCCVNNAFWILLNSKLGEVEFFISCTEASTKALNPSHWIISLVFSFPSGSPACPKSYDVLFEHPPYASESDIKIACLISHCSNQKESTHSSRTQKRDVDVPGSPGWLLIPCWNHWLAGRVNYG